LSKIDKTLFSSVLPTLRTVEVNGLLNISVLEHTERESPSASGNWCCPVQPGPGGGDGRCHVGTNEGSTPRNNFKPDIFFRKE